MEQPIKTALLAYGMSGKIFHAPFLAQHPGFDLAAIVERSKDEARKDYPQVVQLRSVEEVLSDETIELVVVNTPNYTHYDYAKKALLSGKHVLIEKPVCSTREQAEELYQIAAQKKLFVLPYQNRRFDSDFKAVENVVKSRDLGRLVEVQIRFDRYRNEISPKSFKEKDMEGAGILYDLGAHIIDQAISLFGIPDDFEKVYSCNRENSEVDDFAQVLLKYKNGPSVLITTNMLVVEAPPAYSLFGISGTFYKYRTDVQEEQLVSGMKPDHEDYGKEREGSDGKLIYLAENGERVEREITSLRGDYAALFDAVYKVIRRNEPYFVHKEELLAQLNILKK